MRSHLRRSDRFRGSPRSSGDPHRDRDWLRDVILGGQDGLVNILGIILGVIAGGGSDAVLLAAGFAAAITESISMGAVGYTSTVADRDFYDAQQAKEREAIVDNGALKRREITEVFRSKGLSGDLLDRVVSTITADPETWVDTIMSEERHSSPVSSMDILARSVVITLATLAGHLIPLLPFLLLPRTEALVVGLALSAVALFAVGAYQAVTRVGSWWAVGPRMVAIGLGAAGVGFAIGMLFHAAGG